MSLNRNKPFSVPLATDTKARLEALARQLGEQANEAGLPAPSVAFVAREAITLGLVALEKRHAPKGKRS